MNQETRIAVLRWYLIVFGGVSLLAFPAAAMPETWMIAIADFFGIKDFPTQPLTWYLARHLSVMYGLIGLGLLFIGQNLELYRPLVRWFGWGVVLLGGMQLLIDLEAPMPALWTWGESISTAIGGAIIVYLASDVGVASEPLTE